LRPLCGSQTTNPPRARCLKEPKLNNNTTTAPPRAVADKL
jgi:hypothetical protein